MPELLRGTVERISFHNAESGFCVLRLSSEHQRVVSVVGNLPPVPRGERVEARGEWKTDRVHGLQFHATEICIAAPSELEAIERLLGSGLIRGVGRRLAKDLVGRFGNQVFEVIENSPAELRKVRGIGSHRIRMITESWSEHRSVRDLMLFLHAHGVGTARAFRIHRQYGAEAVPLIKQNPYRLADEVRGIGFLSADSIARSLGIEPASPFRIRAALRYLLNEASHGAGHCALPRRELLEQARKLLQIPSTAIEAVLDEEVEKRSLVADTIRGQDVVFPPNLLAAERNIARQLRRLGKGDPPWPKIDPAKAIPWVERRLGIRLAPTQAEAIRLALRSKVFILTGGPGVGKTTLVNSLLTILAAKDVEIELAAPTGRAAKRLAESTGGFARTIHRLLEMSLTTGNFGRNEDHPIQADLLVVDEVSMVDVPLMDALLRATPSEAALLLVGDADQLPSIGPGQVLADLLASGAVPSIRLTEIFRQAGESRIVLNAHRVNQGRMPELRAGSPSDFYFVRLSDPDRAADKIVQLVAERIPRSFGFDPLTEIQVLAPMNRGAAGVESLNAALQAALNPAGLATEAKIERFGTVLAAGDKVMQTENDYRKEVFNGDIGLIIAIDHDRKFLVASFDRREVVYPFDDLDQLTLAYAITVHKSQGSEYPAVVIPVLRQHSIMLRRNLLYTAITRGRRLVVLAGESAAIRQAVTSRRGAKRWSKLAELLHGENE